MTKNDVDITLVIKEDYLVPESKYNGKYNKTTLFLLPMINLNIRDKLTNRYLKNAFIDDEGIQHVYQNCIFLLFNVKNLRERDWQELSLYLKSSPLHILDYYVGKATDNQHLIMHVLQIPDNWIKDYEKFLQGDYSMISSSYKSLFPAKIYNANGALVESIVYGALFKTENLKNLIAKEFGLSRQFVNELDEIWDLPMMNFETYRYKDKII